MKRWSWFPDTYWIVPETGVVSMLYLPGQNRIVAARGQTVFHITDYFNGYFSGATVVKLGVPQVTICNSFVGMITPEGRAFLTFFDPATGAMRNTAVGTMVEKNNQWTMVNEMSSPGDGVTISHWAYMVQSKPGSTTWDDLPVAHESIPEFLSACPPGPPLGRP